MSESYYEETILIEKPPKTMLTASVIMLLSLFYFGLGNDWNTPTTDVDNFQMDEADVEEQAESGKSIWRLAMFAIGAVGGGLLILPSGRRPHIGNPLSIAMLMFIGWLLLSVTWSDNPTLTFRRAMGFMCIFAGTLGVAKHFPATHVCILAVVYGSIVMLTGIAAEVAHGTFAPWDGSYRFAGTAHPNQTAIRVSVLCICSLCLARHYWKWRAFLIPICCCAFAVVFFTKSRTSLAALLLAIGTIWALDTSKTFKLGTLAVCTLLFFLVAGGFLALGVDSLETFGEAVSMGRDDGDDPSSFTGRIPLWEYAIEDILERPILGHGIGSYWSDEQLEDAHHELEWALPDAHNGYIEISLALGITGLFLALLVTALGMKSIGRQEVRSFDRGLAAIFGLCTFGLLNASFESHMSQAFNFTPFVVNCVFCRLAFFPEPRFERQENPEVEFHHEDVAWEASLN